MTDTDPYAGIRTRLARNLARRRDEATMEEIDAEAAAGVSLVDFDDAEALANAQLEAIANINRQLQALTAPVTLDEQLLQANPPPQERTPDQLAFEMNLVPAEDMPAHERIAQLKVLVEDMLHDWQKLNEFFNITARRRDWCSEYEDRLHAYNQNFRVLRMVGRPANWIGSRSNWASADGSDGIHGDE